MELLARGYTREQIAAWQAAITDTTEPTSGTTETKRVTRRRKD
jgi:hypothetical protein